MSAAIEILIDGADAEMACDIINHCGGLPMPREISLDLRKATLSKYGNDGQEVLQAYQAGYVEL
jgi:hypothetical protein